MTAQGDKFRNRPDEDPSTRRTAEDELMRGARDAQGERRTRFDRGIGETASQSLANENTGSLLLNEADADRPAGAEAARESGGSDSTSDLRK